MRLICLRIANFGRAKIFASVLTLVAACGTYVGNPKQPTPAPDDTSKKQEDVVELPLIAIEPPDSLTEEDSALALTPIAQPLGSRSAMRRMKIAIRQFNALATRLNKMAIRLNQTINDDDESTSVRGRVMRTTEDGNLRLTICRKGIPALQLSWSKDGSDFQLIRDHGQKLNQQSEAIHDYLSSVRIEKSAGTTRLTFDHNGLPAESSDSETNTKYLSEHTVWLEAQTGTEIATIADWYLDNGVGKGKVDGAFYAQLSSDSTNRTWQSIGSRRAKCDVAPSTLFPQLPTDWCLSGKGTIGGASQELETQERSDLQTSYESMGTLKVGDLKTIDTSNVSCSNL
jgi:hypothetical protein